MLLTTCLTPLTFLATLVAFSFCSMRLDRAGQRDHAFLDDDLERAALHIGIACQLQPDVS